MKGVLLFILLGSFAALGAYTYLQKHDELPGDKKIDAEYEATVNEAIARNTPEVEHDEVIILYRDDFIDFSSYPTDGSYFTQAPYNPYAGKILEFNVSQQPDYYEYDDENEGYFGTPDLPGVYHGTAGCSGLIYDPCMVLSLTPIPATGDMNFGSTKFYN